MAGKEFAAQVTWAQRKDRLYLTIDVQDCVEPKIDLTNVGEGDAEKHGRVSFRGEGRSHATGSEKHNYTLELELNKAINEEESKVSVSDRKVLLVLAKADEAQGHWPRLLKGTGKMANVKVDWDKWVDEDEEDEKKDDLDLGDLQNLSNFGSGGMGGMGGMPGMGGMGGMPGMGGMGGMGGMAGLGGMGGMGGMDFSSLGAEGGAGPSGEAGKELDSDDEDLPDLEA